MTQQKASPKTNSHSGPNGRPNGNGPAYTPAHPAGGERGGAPASACPPQRACTGGLQGQAASDDASGTSVANATAFPAATSLPEQASTVREAYAEVAPPAPNEPPRLQAAEGNPTNNKKDKPEKELPPGKCPLPDNPAEFVQEIHRKIDLTEAWHALLRSKDEKIRQRAVERLTAMLYDDGAISADEPQQMIMDIDSAAARRAAEGAKK